MTLGMPAESDADLAFWNLLQERGARRMGKLMANSPWGKPTSPLTTMSCLTVALTRPAMLDDSGLAMRLTTTASPVLPKSSKGTAHSGPPVSGRREQPLL